MTILPDPKRCQGRGAPAAGAGQRDVGNLGNPGLADELCDPPTGCAPGEGEGEGEGADDEVLERLVDHQTMADLIIALGLFDGLELSIAVPGALSQAGAIFASRPSGG
jgi:hypothetical protein